MGLIRFAVYPAAILHDWPEVHAGFLTGADGRVFPTRIEVAENIVGCRRTTSESAKFNVTWNVKNFGRMVIPTASLPEREEPYLLPVELARGKIVQVRNQSAQWELMGLKLPAEFIGPHREAHRLFAQAALSQTQPEQACRLADDAIHLACVAGEALTRSYSEQALLGRMQRFGALPVSIGCDLRGEIPAAESTELFMNLFNSATVHVPWRVVESVEGEYDWTAADRQLDWCETQKLMIRGGPLVDLGPNGLPAWLTRWEHDVANLQSFVCDFVETAVSRYVGRIRVWEICSRMCTGGALSLNEEARLTLTARLLDVARQVDDEAQLFIRVDQPWGDYQSRGLHRLAPLQAVDALIRSGVGLSGVNLEVAVGYISNGSAYRDLIECSRLIDLWTMLDVPIFVTLVCPSSDAGDPMASGDCLIDVRTWPERASESIQSKWIEQMLELLVAKLRVAGVYLPHFSDAAPHEFPHAGLLRGDQSAKPVSNRIFEERQFHRRKP